MMSGSTRRLTKRNEVNQSSIPIDRRKDDEKDKISCASDGCNIWRIEFVSLFNCLPSILIFAERKVFH